MKRCRTCLYPAAKPDLHFDETGECAACRAYSKRRSVNWEERHKELLRVLEQAKGRVIVASSGGKDSSYITLRLKELGADVTVVTATTCHLTDIGRKNIDNLARHARTIEVTPNRTVRAKLNRLGLELVGDISHPEHMSIFTTPFRVACQLRIPTIFYGEAPLNEYGGPPGMEVAKEMTRRWVSEFGGFLGLRPRDMVGQLGITERDMVDYLPPTAADLDKAGVVAYWLGQFEEWDSRRNAKIAAESGFRFQLPTQANWWPWENQDNAQTGIHDYLMFRKYGYGRGCAQISVDVRRGEVSRDFALDWVQEHDGIFPEVYLGVTATEIAERIGMTRAEFDGALMRWEAGCLQPA